MSGHHCAVCNTPTEKRCSKCHMMFYCNAAHIAQDWKRHKPMCAMLCDTSLSTVSIPTTPPDNSGEYTYEAIVFPANEDTPRVIPISWEWAYDDDEASDSLSDKYQKHHIRHLFHSGAFLRDKQLVYPNGPDGDPLPDDRCLVVVINDNSLIDGSPINRCIWNLTEGKTMHTWCDNVLALRQRPQDYVRSTYRSANMQEDLGALKTYFMMYGSKLR